MRKQRAKTIQVLYEDNHCLAVFKPAGMPTAGDRTGDLSLLELAREYIKEKHHKPGNVFLGLVHRLDRPVSGVVLLARTSKAAGRLSEQFRKGTVRKAYLAWVEGRPQVAAGTLSDLMVKDRARNVSRIASAGDSRARRAVLGFRVIQRAAQRTMLEIRPATGKPHQIRVQLASRGWPIVGDIKYGAAATQGRSIALHAQEITFEHPVLHRPVTIRVEPPRNWPH